MDRWLLVGLGNPGSQYDGTRHNIGFDCIDVLAGELGVTKANERFHGKWAEAECEGVRIGLLKPMTFMNRSGQAVAEAVRFYKIPVTQILVVHDELDLPFGRLKLKAGGGLAGHNGLRSMNSCLGSADFLRLRWGIGKPSAGGSGANYVLAKFGKAERQAVADAQLQAVGAIRDVLSLGMQAAMNRLHAPAS